MFARKLKIDIEMDGVKRPCPVDWLDGFCMRRFTGEAEFDDTLPQGDGEIRAGFRVDASRFSADLADWLSRKKGKGTRISVHVTEDDGSHEVHGVQDERTATA